MEKNIAVIKGDGIGPEVVDEGLKVLNKIAEKYGHKFNYEFVLAGGAAMDEFDDPLPKESLETCKKSDAVILGALGGPKWDNPANGRRPETGLLELRGGLGLFANLRPAILYDPLKGACPLKDSITEGGLDILIVRELTGGIYFGEKGKGEDFAFDTEKYTKKEVDRIAKVAFDIARKRGKKVCSVDKANVLESSRFWRKCVKGISEEYKDVELSHMYVDNAAMQLVRNPKQFDVIVTSNMFGDILSDEASMITGSIGMLPSASLREDNVGMYEPIHGSAPDIAGQGIANPLATILSISMMLKYSFSLFDEADAIEKAVLKVLEDGYRTKDIMSEGMNIVSTSEMGDLVSRNLGGKL